MSTFEDESTAKELEGEVAAEEPASKDDPSLSEVDKTLADSFPASDPPAQP